MSRELWLLRHAKADRNLAVDDFDRPLKKRGKHDAVRLGEWLLQQGLLPDWVVSSPAKSALATAKLVCDALAADGVLVVQDQRLYQQGVGAITAVLGACPQTAERVLLVGHNPELEALLVYLVEAQQLPDTDKLMPTAAWVRLRMPDDWSQLDAGCADLLAIVLAKSLLLQEGE